MAKFATMSGASFIELAEQPSVSLGESAPPNRSSGFDLAFARMKSRRIGGTFVQDGIPLHVLDIIPKGDYPRSTHEERFVRPGSAHAIAAQFVGEEAFDEILREMAAMEKLQQQEEEERLREETERMAALERAAAEQRAKEEEEKSRVQALSKEWEAEFYGQPEEHEGPTEEEMEQAANLKISAGNLGIPASLLDVCVFPSEVDELMGFKKEFSDLDVDGSGQLDRHEMKLAMAKLGFELDDAHLGALLGGTDESGDGQVDFEEFVLLIRRFQSSGQERVHQGTERGGLSGLADAMRNLDISREETEFGSQLVVKRRDVKEWENYMQFPDPLHWAAGKGDLRAVEQFVKGADGAPPILADWINKDGSMPLHYAAAWNQVHVIRFLLEPGPHGAGAGVDPADAHNRTPLMVAAARGAREACELLLRRWANPCQRSDAGTTALHTCCLHGQAQILAGIIAAGAVVSASEDESIRLWSLKEPGVLCRPLISERRPSGRRTEVGPAACMEVFQDRIATGHPDGTVVVASVTTQQAPPYALKGREAPAVFTGHSGTVLCVRAQRSCSTTPGSLMVSGSEDTTVRLWDIPAVRCLQVYRDTRPSQHPSAVLAVDFDAVADRVVGGTRGGVVLVWRLADGEFLQAFLPHIGSPVNAVQLDGNQLLTAASDRTLRLWDMAAPRSRVFGGAGSHGHKAAVRCAVRVAADTSFEFPLAETVVSGAHNGELFVWEVPPGADNVDAPAARLAGGGGGGGGGDDGGDGGADAAAAAAAAFDGPVLALKVCVCGDLRLIVASSTAENGVGVWRLRGREGNDLLHRFLGHTGDVHSLGWCGPDVNLSDPTGVTPLMVAAEEGHAQALAVLLGCVGINPWVGDAQYCETALHRAARRGHPGCMRLLLEHDPLLVSAAAGDMSSVLHRAVEDDAAGVECVRVALAAGADAGLFNARGDTPLHVAARLGRYHALRELIHFDPANPPDLNAVGAAFPIGGLPIGRPPQAPPEHRFPALQRLPLQYTTTSVARVLAASKSRAGARAVRAEVATEHRLLRHPHGWAALHEACAAGRSACVKVLLAAAADPNLPDDAARTPLHLACANGAADQVRLLLDARAGAHYRDAAGCTPLHYAVKVGQDGAVRMLLARGGRTLDPDAAEEVDGLTALHMAAKYGFEDIAFALLAGGADVNRADHRLNTPLHYAVAGAVGRQPEPSAPEVPAKVAAGGCGVAAAGKVRRWLRHWQNGTLRTPLKGFRPGRVRELQEESADKAGRFVETAQVLLDGFARFDLRDGCGRTAREYAAAAAEVWASALGAMFGTCAADGTAFLVLGDRVTATYLGEAGTRFEHPNLWRLESCFGVRCAAGTPRMAGSRAFKRSESRYGKQEVDHRDLGLLRSGEAGELQRAGSAVYVLGLEYEEQATGGRRLAEAHLCAWAPGKRTFETKLNALAVGLEPGATYTLRVVAVDEWAPDG